MITYNAMIFKKNYYVRHHYIFIYMKHMSMMTNNNTIFISLFVFVITTRRI